MVIALYQNFNLSNPQIVRFDSRCITFKCACGKLSISASSVSAINGQHTCKACRLAAQLNAESRNSTKYNLWRQAVLANDSFSCLACRTHSQLVVHIESWSSNKELRFSLNNGITLCKNCHTTFHSKYGHKVTRVDLINFLEV